VSSTSGTSTHVLPGDPPVEVILRRSGRAKRFSLRVSRSDGRVSMSLPLWAPEDEALAFLHDRADWVRGHLDRAPGPRFARIGETIPLFGVARPILQGNGRAARFEDGHISVPAGPREAARVKALLTTMARERLASVVAEHSAKIGRRPGRLTLRDPRSRWGSCSTKGDLMFSFRLIMTPPEVLDYVAAHEVAHLAEMNHGPAFWSLCRQLCPATETHRRWLKNNGAALLAWRFDTGSED